MLSILFITAVPYIFLVTGAEFYHAKRQTGTRKKHPTGSGCSGKEIDVIGRLLLSKRTVTNQQQINQFLHAIGL